MRSFRFTWCPQCTSLPSSSYTGTIHRKSLDVPSTLDMNDWRSLSTECGSASPATILLERICLALSHLTLSHVAAGSGVSLAVVIACVPERQRSSNCLSFIAMVGCVNKCKEMKQVNPNRIKEDARTNTAYLLG
jgi:hypothetical protein